MKRPAATLLMRLAQRRGIPFRSSRLPTSRWFKASDGVDLHCLDWPGQGETLILLHGGGLSAHTFDLVALALDRDLRCIAVDLRGHGSSGWAEDYSVERWALDIIELVEQLNGSEVHLAAMSLGGCIAGHSAKALESRLKSLTFIDVGSKVNFDATATMRAFFDSVRPVDKVQDLVDDALAVSPRTDPDLMLYRYQSLLHRKDQGYVWRADRRRPNNFPQILAKMAELNDIAPSIDCPVLVVKGARSNVMTCADAEDFAGRFRQGRLVVVHKAGHNVQEDQPVALAHALRTTTFVD